GVCADCLSAQPPLGSRPGPPGKPPRTTREAIHTGPPGMPLATMCPGSCQSVPRQLPISAHSNAYHCQCHQGCPSVPHISAAYQCPSVPRISAQQCRLSCPSVPTSATQCHPSVPPINAHQCCISVPPINAAYQWPSVPHISAHRQCPLIGATSSVPPYQCLSVPIS
ncbi:hypothetical protein AB205_0161040, partial [Aquarana catesbeiana]